MKPPFPAPVDEWHNDTYEAINPTRPELSQAGKVIVITGGGSGLGRDIAEAYALAGATTIHVIGRTIQTLEETKSLIESKYPKAQVAAHVADISDRDATIKAAKAIGNWNVLVGNAGYLPTAKPITEDPDDWWRAFEVKRRAPAWQSD